MKIPLVFFNFLLVTGCIFNHGGLKSADTSFDEPKNRPAEFTYQSIAHKKYSNTINYLFNNDSSFVVCIGHPVDSRLNSTHFFIYSIKASKINFEENAGIYSVQWINGNVVKVERIPGMIRAGDQSANALIYYYDVITRKHTTQFSKKP